MKLTNHKGIYQSQGNILIIKLKLTNHSGIYKIIKLKLTNHKGYKVKKIEINQSQGPILNKNIEINHSTFDVKLSATCSCFASEQELSRKRENCSFLSNLLLKLVNIPNSSENGTQQDDSQQGNSSAKRGITDVENSTEDIYVSI